MRLETTPARGARLGLTPIIDVVFLLLLFFMLASTFGRFIAVDLSLAGGDVAEAGPAVVLTVAEGGVYRLDGKRVESGALAAVLANALPEGEGRIVVRPMPRANAQEIVDAVEHARAAGVGPVVLAR